MTYGNAQQQPGVFDAKAAERFAALWAGFDTGNLPKPKRWARVAPCAAW